MNVDWFSARKAAKEGRLDEFLEEFDLNEEETTTFIETLFALESASGPIPPQPADYPTSGIYTHYLAHLLTEFQHSEFDPELIVKDVDGNVRDTVSRLSLRKPQLRTPSENRPGYGLVIGRIQSGKTAHLIGLILHALDSDENKFPYDTVIVLSGLIDDLRKQTLERMEDSVMGYSGTQPVILPSKDSDLSSGDTEWLPKIRQHFLQPPSKPMIIVIKKNHVVLELLRSCLPPPSKLANRRVLIIDDEADHASMDTGGDEQISETGEEIVDDNPSETNRQLRLLVKQFQFSKSCWYIGYTATPFANLLSHPWSSLVEDEYGLSLHPRDMLHALGKPRGHYDNEQYFLVPDSQNLIINPEFIEHSEEERETMRDLIYRHILTNEIKKLRGINKHHTTLIHTAVNVDEHKRIALIIRSLVDNFFSDSSNAEQIYPYFHHLIEEYCLPSKLQNDLLEKLYGILLVDFDKFTDILHGIGIIEVNRRKRHEGENSPQDLDYSVGPRSYIAVGGTRLSRGLTLEGLTTSWFSRRANEPKYDTMLQMARWCGYRPKYDDLVRIITTEQIRMDYVLITNEENDLRRKIQSLPEDADPLDEEIWIREHPGMHLTSPEKKEDAISRTWGSLNKTTVWSWASLETSDGGIKKNKKMYTELKKFIVNLGFYPLKEPKSGATNFSVAYGVNGQFVLDLLNKYHDLLEDSGSSDTKNDMRILIEDNDWLPLWNVGIHTPDIPNKTTIAGKKIGLVNRSTTKSGNFKIVQNSANDTIIDINEGQVHRNRPLLLLYLIDPDSTQGNKGIERVFAKGVKKPVTSFGICLPADLSEDGGMEWTADKGDL